MALTLAACGDSSGPDDSRTLSISIAVPRPGAAANVQASYVPVRDAAGNTLDITRADIVIAELEIETDQRDCDSSGPGNCHEFETGPLLLSLPVNGGVLSLGSDPLPFNVISEVELEIERPDEDDARTVQFRAANPNFPRTASVRIVGTFNGQAFDVFLSPEAELELEFSPPLTVGEGGLNITIQINVTDWLRNANGNFLDPRALASDGAARNRVEDNIKRSFKAFRDANRDGSSD
ncbi:MAG: hypothetical protein ACT4O1_04860 [Gemmatimonadota bacterium]